MQIGFKSSAPGIGSRHWRRGPPDQAGSRRKQENCMKTFAKLLTLGLVSFVLAVAPVVTSVYAAPDEPKPSDDGKKKKKGGNELRPDSEQVFATGYRAAYDAIYSRGEY